MQLSVRQNHPFRNRGFTLTEVLLALAILAILGSIALPMYQNYRERMQVGQAKTDIQKISAVIQAYFLKHSAYPENLGEVHMGHMKDPWGNAYAYLNIETADTTSPRQDRSLKPINSDYDLYSVGKDGATRKNIGASVSRDDVIRANNGGYVGLAEEY